MTDSLHYFQASRIARDTRSLKTDVAVYGATSAGVIAAVRARLSGKTVILLNPGAHIGGLSSSGLGYTDLGNTSAIGGLSRGFYRDMGGLYGVDEIWKFEPHKARKIFKDYIDTYGVQYVPQAWPDAVDMEGRAIRRVYFAGGLSVEAKAFIDTSYEGDLMALAGVPWTMGRESNGTYGESINGQQLHHTHQFDQLVDPYVLPGKPESGLLPFVEDGEYHKGAGDRRMQAYNFRICMTDDPSLKIPFPKPRDYKPDHYELLARFLQTTQTNIFQKFDRITPVSKTDTNNHGAVSTDFIGGNQGWVHGSPAEREVIFQAHVAYQQGLHWFMANDGRVPASIRAEYARWGLAGDEFADTGHWPPQLYVREARRMLSDYVVTERDCLRERVCEDPVGMAAYQMDSHNIRRIVVDGAVRNEGDVQIRIPRPYPVSYRAIVPPRGSVANLAAPVCLSASHIAFGSVRMEPVFMILADSAAQAAVLAIDEGLAFQDLSYTALRDSLDRNGQVCVSEHANSGDGNP